MSKDEAWDRRSIEIPPGWHALFQEISDATGVKLKYLYTVAVDQLLTNIDIQRLADKAWKLQRETRQDLAGVGARHTAKTLRKLEGGRQPKPRSQKP